MLEADVEVLREHVLFCSQETFATCSIPVELDEGDACDLESAGQVAAFIGFNEPKLRGMLTIVAPFALMRVAYPVELSGGGDVDDEAVLDWSGEVANQLLGRIKNQLSIYGIELKVSTPKAMQASRLWIAKSTRTSVCALRSSVGDALIGVWFDAEVEPGVRLFAHAFPPAPDRAAEGDFMMF